MLSIFKKTSKEDKLYKKYEKLMGEYHRLSTINRNESDEKYNEAQLILEEIDQLKKN